MLFYPFSSGDLYIVSFFFHSYNFIIYVCTFEESTLWKGDNYSTRRQIFLRLIIAKLQLFSYVIKLTENVYKLVDKIWHFTVFPFPTLIGRIFAITRWLINLEHEPVRIFTMYFPTAVTISRRQANLANSIRRRYTGAARNNVVWQFAENLFVISSALTSSTGWRAAEIISLLKFS